MLVRMQSKLFGCVFKKYFGRRVEEDADKRMSEKKCIEKFVKQSIFPIQKNQMTSSTKHFTPKPMKMQKIDRTYM